MDQKLAFQPGCYITANPSQSDWAVRKGGIREVRHWCWAINPSSWSVFQFTADLSSPCNLKAISLCTLLCGPGHCHCGRGKTGTGNCYHKCGQALLSNTSVPVFFGAWNDFCTAENICFWRLYCVWCVSAVIQLGFTLLCLLLHQLWIYLNYWSFKNCGFYREGASFLMISRRTASP